MNINVSNLRRSSEFYGPLFRYLGYERTDFQHEGEWAFEDWKRWLEGTPYEISIVQAHGNIAYRQEERRAVGRHNHIAFCAEDREDIDRLYQEVLAPLEKEGLCVVENPPCDCPEYGDGYYATFFFDPDGLKYEFVINPNYFRKKKARDEKLTQIQPSNSNGIKPNNAIHSTPSRGTLCASRYAPHKVRHVRS